MSARPVRRAEDYQPGQLFELGSCEVTREEIVEFAARYDPHLFHLDESALRRSPSMAVARDGNPG
jgi:acyl dehydratase